MPKRDPGLLIEDILASMRKVERYTAGMDREQFQRDDKTVDAVVRNLEIIGEATRQLPQEFTVRHPDLPWRKIAGLRNRIVHEYFGLDLEILWQIIQHDLVELKAGFQDLGSPGES